MPRCAVVLGVSRAVLALFNVRALHDGIQYTVFLHAYAACHMAVFGQRVFQMVAHHRPMCLFTVFLHVPEERADLLKRLAAVEIVRVDDNKRRINVVACR